MRGRRRPSAAMLRHRIHAASLLLGMLLSGCTDRHSILSDSGNLPAVTRLQKPAEPAPAVVPASLRSSPPAESKIANSHANPEDNPASVAVVAHVNGQPILNEELRDALIPYLQQYQEPERSARLPELKEKALQDLIDRELLLYDVLVRIGKNRPKVIEKLKEAAKKDWDKHLDAIQTELVKKGARINSREDMRKLLHAQGYDLEAQRRVAERRFMSREYLMARVYPNIEYAITREQVYDYYEQHENEFRVEENVQWQDLFIDASRFPSRKEAGGLAAKLAARARAGEDFVQLVKQYDQGDSSFRNGEGEGHRRGEIRPVELEAVLFNLRDGEVGPVVEGTNGFHVVRVVKREVAGKRKLDDKLQKELLHKLQNEAMAREIRRFMADLRQRAAIEIAEGVLENKKEK